MPDHSEHGSGTHPTWDKNQYKQNRRYKMNPFVKFMASTAGRITRIVAGIVLVVLGFFVVDNTVVGIILIVIGLVPLVAGLFDFCVFAPLFGAPMSGPKIRSGK
jgi:membrane-bound ClpP family serine protease